MDGEKVSFIFSTAIEAVRCTKDAGTGGKAEAWKDMQKDLQRDLEKDPILDLQKDLQKDLRLTLVQVLTSSPPSLPPSYTMPSSPPSPCTMASSRHHPHVAHARRCRTPRASQRASPSLVYLYSVLNFST